MSLPVIKANGSYGTAGQVLATNGSAVYWTADQGANAITANSLTANLYNYYYRNSYCWQLDSQHRHW